MVDVSEVARSLARFGDRYARRVFSDDELALWPGAVPARACADLAERFAGKEATIKVLAPGDQGLDWRSIEVRRHRPGGCSVRLSGTAAALAQEAGISRVMLSVSSAGGVAMAVAVGSGGGSGRRRPGGCDSGREGGCASGEIRKDAEA
jgi:holo-[acyl-carrier protein] synthase